ncbi:MAG: hypothetical protein JNK78_02835 [Planctomycetes bacterium]|nr:hypothetical protein [Planctomycetota bacterium]
MDQEPFETAVCAASDLAARLTGELAQAVCQLAAAERRFDAAAADAHVLHIPIPAGVRSERNERRREVRLLRHILGGMPNTHGGLHAASA